MSLARAILAAPSHDAHSPARPTLSIPEISDAALIAQLRSSDRQIAERAFDIIYHAFHARLIAIARTYVARANAEEIVQDVFARFWDRRLAIPPDLTVGVYLYTATRNAAISAKRHDRVVTVTEHDNQERGLALGTFGGSADEEMEHQDILAAIEQALSSLPEGMRTAFTLRWIHELSYPEISHIMGIAEPAARKQVSRAREAVVPVLKRFVDERL